MLWWAIVIVLCASSVINFLHCVRSRGHIFCPIVMKLGQNVCLDEISDELMKSRMSSKMGHVWSKTRSLGEILEKPCVRSRGHIFSPIIMKLGQNLLSWWNLGQVRKWSLGHIFESKSRRLKWVTPGPSWPSCYAILAESQQNYSHGLVSVFWGLCGLIFAKLAQFVYNIRTWNAIDCGENIIS